jgi:predicted unusual protein kinase regulating ubiquinone biosynthesis (AarF/ABC1/UbiB family)
VPRVAWSHASPRVLTLENVYAIKITDYDAIRAAGIDLKQVAAVLFDTYLKQIFEDQFFHADPHPGNLFVTPIPATEKRAATWRLTFVDFGMVGHIPGHLRDGLREMLIAIGTRNSAKMVEAYRKVGMLLPTADLKLLEKAEAQLFDRFWGMSMSELRRVDHTEMREFAHQFRDLMYEMPFQIPHDLLLLGRTIAILSGMCTGLDPDFNVWTRIAPYAQKLVTEEVGPGWQVWLDQAGEVVKQLVALPGQFSRLLDRLERGELGVDIPQIDQQIFYVEAAINRLLGGLIFAMFLFGGVLLVDRGLTTPGYLFWGLSALTLFWTFLTWGHAPKRAR